MTKRASRKPERPRRFHRSIQMGDRNRQLPGPRWDAHDRGEQTTGDTVVSAREAFERVETDGGESERPVVSLKRGNHPEGPRGETRSSTPRHSPHPPPPQTILLPSPLRISFEHTIPLPDPTSPASSVV